MRARILVLALFLFTSTAWADIELLRSEAGAAAGEGRVEDAISIYRELLVEAPDDGQAHYRLGSLQMDNDDDPSEVIAHFERAADLGFQPLGAGYRLSRVFARQGKTEKALAQLESITAAGFALPALIEGQEDFAKLAGNDRFQVALETISAARFPCAADARHSAFDFWIGKWDVYQAGQFAGTNDIQPILGHCTLLEQWHSPTGGDGKSFNYYDPGHDHWRQIWISDSGTFIEFTGEARDGGIFYTAETVNPADGSVTNHKFEFTQNGDGTVRQFWQTSADAGETWTTIWDGLYKRQTEASE